MAEAGIESKMPGFTVLVLNHGECMNKCISKCLNIISLYGQYAARVFENSVSVIISPTSKGVNKSFMDGKSEAQRRMHLVSSSTAACAHTSPGQLLFLTFHSTAGLVLLGKLLSEPMSGFLPKFHSRGASTDHLHQVGFPQQVVYLNPLPTQVSW